MRYSVFSSGRIQKRVRSAPALVAALMLAGCVPTLPTAVVTTSGAQPIVSQYRCPIDGFVTVARTDTYVVLTTSFGSETFFGALPAFYGEEASLTFGPGQNVMVLAAPGEQQSCDALGFG